MKIRLCVCVFNEKKNNLKTRNLEVHRLVFLLTIRSTLRFRPVVGFAFFHMLHTAKSLSGFFSSVEVGLFHQLSFSFFDNNDKSFICLLPDIFWLNYK